MSLRLATNMVAAFHARFGQPILKTPQIADEPRMLLRHALIREEARELTDALWNRDLPEIADGIGDLIFVALGTALEYGIDMTPVFDVIARTNMLKMADPAGGKVAKPDGWEAPDIAGILREQGWKP